jgi:3-oxoacyl-[acyl-carrier-protein] synthase II
MGKRVVVTGIGCIAPCGIGRNALESAMRAGRSHIRRITRFDASTYTTRIAGEVDSFNPGEFMDRRDADRLDRGTQFTVAATREALEDARLAVSRLDPARAGVTLGVAAATMEFYEGRLLRSRRGDPLAFPSHFYPALATSACSAVVARLVGLRGRAHTVTTGCTAGAEAIGYAFRQIRAGRADVMIAGGADAPLAPLTFSSFTVIRAMSTRNDAPERASRPFDKDRDGFVMSEGAGVVVLEEREQALRRGARIYMEVVGYGTTLNAYHMTAPHPEGVESARAIRLALADGGVTPVEVDYISAHGSSTPLNEVAETKAIKAVFGDHARRLCVSSVKSLVGHAFGGAGGHQAVAAALTFARDLIPPTANLEAPDPACDLDCVPQAPRRRRVRCAVQNGCGFSGKNAVLVYRRHESEAEAGIRVNAA